MFLEDYQRNVDRKSILDITEATKIINQECLMCFQLDMSYANRSENASIEHLPIISLERTILANCLKGIPTN